MFDHLTCMPSSESGCVLFILYGYMELFNSICSLVQTLGFNKMYQGAGIRTLNGVYCTMSLQSPPKLFSLPLPLYQKLRQPNDTRSRDKYSCYIHVKPRYPIRVSTAGLASLLLLITNIWIDALVRIRRNPSMLKTSLVTPFIRVLDLPRPVDPASSPLVRCQIYISLACKGDE